LLFNGRIIADVEARSPDCDKDYVVKVVLARNGGGVLRTILLCLSFLMTLTLTAGAQQQSFSKEGVEFVLDLPSSSWRAVTRIDVHEHVEFINGQDKSNGYLRLRKKLVAPGTTAAALFAEEEKWELSRLPGYVVCCGGKGTEFSGHLKGTWHSYEFVRDGMNMDGRLYYLQADSRTFYVLHFTVASEKLVRLVPEMDFIARSFRLK
jgi:hypothetical protein